MPANINRSSIFKIVCVSLCFKVAFLLFYYFILLNGLDTLDMEYYYHHGQWLLSGQIPYLDFGFDYPPIIFIPIVISLLVTSGLTQFTNIFCGFLILCDLVTALCVYLIALEIFNRDDLALRGALVYATALEIAYFTMTKFDPLPTMIMMLSLLFTIKGAKFAGYYSHILGVFTKIFPILLSPFIFLYNAHQRPDFIVGEIRSIWRKVLAPVAVLFSLAAWVLLTPDENTGSWAHGSIYVNTIGYTVYDFLYEVLGFNITIESIIICEYALMGLILFSLLVYAYFTPQTPQLFIKIILAVLFTFVALWSYHSPQYLFWYIPLIAILIADDLLSILLFYIVQFLAFLEFPQTAGVFYTNTVYRTTLAADPYHWGLTWGMFALFQFALVYLVYRALTSKVRPTTQEQSNL